MSDKKAPAESGDDKTKPFQQAGKATQKDGNADSTDSAPPVQKSPTKPDEPRGIVADKQKGMGDGGPTGVLGDAPPKTELLGVPEEPKLGIVGDTPKALYAERTKPKTAEWLGERGGTIASQKAVEDGLDWLARHQGKDGHWGADCLGADPNSRCEKKAPCQETGQAYEIAQTGLALLAFQAAGHYYFNDQKYSGQVKKGLDYFIEEQAPDGSIVGSQNPSAEQIAAGAPFQQHFMYEHAMGTFALCEACAVAVAEGKMPDPRYQTAAERAVAFIEKIQHDDGGWRYTTNARDQSDCSVSGWVMLALKTAREANISVSPKTISRMVDFFAANYADGRTNYGAAPNHPSDAMTGVGMMAVEFFEHKLDSPIVKDGATYLADKADALTQPLPGPAGAQMLKAFQSLPPAIAALPASFDPSINYYLWYNCTMAMFQVGGEPWKRWNGAVRDRVISLQIHGEGCDRGSWPPNDQYSGRGGRIYSTALAVLTLEVYYRFQRVASSPARNNVRDGQQLPETWDVGEIDEETREWLPGTGKNIRWVALLGSETNGTPVVAGGKVFIGTNNHGGRVPRYPSTVDLGCLLCFREADGGFLWQHSSEKLPTGREEDWPMAGVCSTPLVEGNRLWFVSNRCEVICLDVEGFRDGQNDGPFRDEADQALDEADVVWKLDMRKRFGVHPHSMSNCSVTSAGRLLFVCTSNGVDVGHTRIPAPGAPSFLALDKATGEVLWTDASPGKNILHGQWSSPCYGVFDGQPQVMFGGGDGWLYSFDPAGDGQGGSKLLWKFDGNPKLPVPLPIVGGRATRNHLIASPVIHDGFVYIATGEDPEHGAGEGRLCCIDPRKRGDVSSELAVDGKNGNRAVPARRLQAVNPAAGEEVVENPNSALVWDYLARDANADGIIDFEELMHRTVSSPVIADGLLVIPDFSGLVHCLDARTGEVCWTHDIFAECWASPLASDGRVYVGDQEGKVTIFKLSRRKQILAEIDMQQSISSTPVAAGGVLYVATRTHLFAIGADK